MMEHIRQFYKNPKRLFKYISIKIFNKKIHALKDLDKHFNRKTGLEIGGPSRIFGSKGYIPVYTLAKNVDGVNFSTNTVWENTIEEGQTYNYGSNLGYQYIADAIDLSKIESNKYDFLLSSHSLEHIANPFRALTEWFRVLKKGGAFVLVLPDKNYTFDFNRPITTYRHLLKDFKEGILEDDLTHLDEICELHDLSRDPGVKDLEEFKKRSEDNLNIRCLHHHVFDFSLIEQIFNHFNLQIVLKDTSPPFNLIVIGIKN